MWHDNEAARDLVGYQAIADALAGLCTNTALLPLTIGLYGSWGSGKSSVLSMIEHALEPDARVVCVRFDGWQLEAYDDVRAALMSTVLEALEPHVQTADVVQKVRVKVDWMRAAGLVGKGLARFGSLMTIAPSAELAAAGAVGEALPEVLQTVSVEKPVPPSYAEELAASARGFREAFENLIADASVDALVVLIDDLDRCLPESVVSILEAIKLFMAVRGTSFVLAVDDQVVNLAVMDRFATAPNALEMARNYLEKLIQVPVALPALSAVEAETYVYLLYAEASLDPAEFDALYARVSEGREDPSVARCLNFGIAQDVLTETSLSLIEHDFAVAQAIAPLLGRLAGGNPRTIKRFLNTIELRLLLWPPTAGSPDKGLLAKLLLLERFHRDRFDELARWQASGGGRSDEVIDLERAARLGLSATEATSKWLEQPALLDWLKSEPSVDTNLSPYFNLARVVAADAMQGGHRLSALQQGLLVRLRSDLRATRVLAISQLKELEAGQVDEIVRILAVGAEEGGAQSRDLDALLDMGVAQPILAASALTVVERLPLTDLSPAHIAKLGTMAKAEPDLLPRVVALLHGVRAAGGRSAKAAGQLAEKLEGA